MHTIVCGFLHYLDYSELIILALARPDNQRDGMYVLSPGANIKCPPCEVRGCRYCVSLLSEFPTWSTVILHRCHLERRIHDDTSLQKLRPQTLPDVLPC
jgi:hypothetical protein